MVQLLNPSLTTSTAWYGLYAYHHHPDHHNQPELEFLVREAHGLWDLTISECSSFSALHLKWLFNWILLVDHQF